MTADTPVPYRMADLIKQIDERMGQLESKNDRPAYSSLKDAHRGGDRRSALPLHVQLAADRGHDPRDDRQDLPGSASRPAGHLLRDGRHALRGRQFRLFGAGASGLRPGAVERGQASPAPALRGSASLHAVRSAARLRADPARNVAHRQGRPQIRLLSRRRQPAPRRARSDHPVAVLDLLRHAARQRAGPGDHPLGDRRFLGIDAVLPVVDGPARSDRLRRGRRDDDAVQVREGARPICCRAPARRPTATMSEEAGDVDLASIVERCATFRRFPPPPRLR